MGPNLRIAPARLEDSMRVRLQRLYPAAKLLAGGEAVVVPLPRASGEPVADADLADSLVRLNEIQNAYTAALQSGGLLMRTSLLDYIR